MQLAGELSKISLPSLIQLVRNGGLTGEISLSQGTNSATIYVEQGRIIHVESDLGLGREAFLELFLWLTGTFSFVESKPGDDIPRTFPSDEPIDRLLREGVAYLEEKKYLDQLRINAQTILKPTAAARRASDAPLLDRLDGKRTLGQALADASLSRRAYVKAVYQLLSEGLVVVAEPVAQGDHVDLPGWVVARLKQDNPNLSQAIVDMVIWVDRIKCWMYQADADLERVIGDLGGGSDELLAEQVAEQVSTITEVGPEDEPDEQAATSEPTAIPGGFRLPPAAPFAPGVSVSKTAAPAPAVQPIASAPSAPPASETTRPGVSTPPMPQTPIPPNPYAVARATAQPPPAGTARASDITPRQETPPEPEQEEPPPAPVAEEQAQAAEEQTQAAEEQTQAAEEQTQVAEEPPNPAEVEQDQSAEAPQAIPRAPWTRAAMAKKPFLGNPGSKPSGPRPRSIEF